MESELIQGIMKKYLAYSNGCITGTHIPELVLAWRSVKKSWKITAVKSGSNLKEMERDVHSSLQYPVINKILDA
jgi:hypothetical protein